MKPLNVGILGAGNISKAYFPSIARYGRYLRLLGVSDINMAAATAASEANGVSAMSVDEMLNTDEIELVINLTIPSAHAPLNQQILESGKHAYCEKPFALNRRSGYEVLRKAGEHGLKVGSAPDTVLGPGIQAARKCIDDGAIGEPQYVFINLQGAGPEHWHGNPGFYYEPGGGPLWDMGPYYFSSLIHFFGPAVRVAALGGQALGERVARAGPRKGETFPVEVTTRYQTLLGFAGGVSVQACFSFDLFSKSNAPRFEVVGTEGTLAVPDPNVFDGEVWLSRASSGTDQPRNDFGWEKVEHTFSHAGSRGLGVADMAVAIRSGREHRASAEIGIHTVDIFRCVDRSLQTKNFEQPETSCERPPQMPEGLGPDAVEED